MVSYVKVVLASPLLELISLVDTPGIGSIQSGSGEITLGAVAQADALVFVVDASSPITAAELEFLDRTAGTIEFTSVVLTKTDRYPSWRAIRRDDEELLGKKRAELSRAPVFPVSSVIAATEVESAEVRTEAGFDQIDSYLVDGVLRNANVIGSANVARACLSLLASIDHQLQILQVADRSAEIRAQLVVEQQRLQAFSQESATWRSTLDKDLKRLLEDCIDMIQLKMRGVESAALQNLSGGAGRHPDEFMTEVHKQIAAVGTIVFETTRTRLEAIADEVLSEVEQSSILDLVDGENGFVEGDWKLPLPGERKRSGYDRIQTFSSFNSGRFIAVALTPLLGSISGGLGPVGAVIGLGIGVASAHVSSAGRKQMAVDGDLRSWVSRQVGAASTRLVTCEQRLVARLGPSMTSMVMDRIRQHTGEIERLIEQQKAQLSQTEAQAQRQREEIGARRGKLAGLRDELEVSIERMREAAGSIESDAALRADSVD